MPIATFLSIADIRIDVPAAGKAGLLRELSGQAALKVGLESNVVARDILKRETLGSTGLGGGIAVPHARIPGLDRPFGMLTRLRKPIEFEAVDGQPVDIVFLLLLTTAANGDQLSALASVARRLRDPRIVEKLRNAKDETALYCILARDEVLAPA